ncbi:MAG: glycine cleavage system aminomethyltransferase GcvT, partial [Chitinophagaceae bacterium]|nr:glycine cleavage system aminomethyltransferase GcvT [Chitinophagaceae bacterium]
YTFAKGKFAGVDNVVVSATGYTGAGGVEIYFKDEDGAADIIWDKMMELGIKPIGLAARDTLRLEMGFCLYGNDIDDTTSPLEGGLAWITKFTKEFTAKAILEKQKATGVQRKLVGFEMVDRGIPRHDYIIKDAAGNAIGKVTSGTQAPSLGKAVGLGYVAIEHAALDSEIFIDIRNTLVKAKVVKAPFV